MSNVSILLIILINQIYLIITVSQCDLSSVVDLQSATYTHSLILRVQSIYSSEEINKNLNQTITRKVLVREVMKTSTSINYQIKINDIIIIRIDDDIDKMLDDSCWQLLGIGNVDIIIFLNETNTSEFDLNFPPIESTLRVRQNIDAVLNYDTYSPQVIIKTRIDKAVVANDYSLQCNARGNPLPRLLWSKKNQTLEYYPLAKQCQTSCRIYSIQNKYQSILYFQSLRNADSGIYICHAENAINYTMASVYLNVDRTDTINRSNIKMTCATLKFCHDRGQCIIVDNQSKCLCDSQYFGEQCETNSNDIIKKHDNAILLFKSRFLTGFILILISFILIVITFLSCFLAKYKREKYLTSKSLTNGTIPSIHPVEQITKPEISQSLSIPVVRIVNNRSILTKEFSTITDDDNKYGPVSTNIDEERFPLKNNNSEEFDIEQKTQHLILSEDFLEYYQPDAKSGLIKPLTIRTDGPKRYSKSYHRCPLPRSVNQQR